MRVLCVCEWGENRSVTVAHHLKFLGHETIAIGVKSTLPATRKLLYQWADRIIVVDEDVAREVRTETSALDENQKVQLWNIGPDYYPRPMNKQLVGMVRKLVDQHKDEYVGTTPYWKR